MKTHTPGPWRWMSADALVADHGRRRAIVTSGIDGRLQTCGDDGLLRPLDVDEANARLIAAAPELLEALKVAVETIRIWHGFGHNLATAQEVWALYQSSPEMQLITAALAKAEGRP